MASNKYLDFTGLSHFLDKIKSIFAPKKQGVEYINGTQTAATGNWTGETADNELYEGKMIAYRLPFAGSGNATLNLTFANGTTSGAKNVYLSTSTRMTTHVGAGNTIILVYHEANVIGSTTYQGWWMDAYYNSNDSAYQMFVYGGRGGHTVTNCPPTCIFLTQAENRLLPTWAGTANSTAATHVMTTEEFDPFGRIYYKSSTGYNAGALISQSLWYQANVDLRYAFNTAGFDLLDNGVGTTVYMVCEPTTNGKAVLHDNPITKTLPIEDDGLLYVYLGRSNSQILIFLMLDHPVYMFDADAGEAIAIDRSYLLDRDKNRIVTETDPYIYRQTGDGKAIGDIEVLDKIVGGTVCWNQLATMLSTHTEKGITFTKNSDGSLDITGTVTEAFNYNQLPLTVSAKYKRDGRVYFISSNKDSLPFQLGMSGYSGSSRPYIFWKQTNETDWNGGVICLKSVTVGSVLNISNLRIMSFDFTQMFGSTIADYIYSLETANAGAGVAWFKRYFPNDYYAYNPGELISVTGLQEHKTVGKNLFDENVLDGLANHGVTKSGSSWVGSVGAWISTNIRDDINDTLHFLENTSYTIFVDGTLDSSGTTHVKIRFFYSDGSYADYNGSRINAGSTGTMIAVSDSAKTLSKVCFTYGSGVMSSIFTVRRMSVSIFCSETDYEPYISNSTTLNPNVKLRGIYSLDSSNKLTSDGDIWTPDGKIERHYGEIDLGQLDYARSQSGLFRADGLQGIIRGSINTARATGWILSSMYSEIGSSPITGPNGDAPSPNLVMAVNSAGQLYFNNTDYSDVSAFKTAMSGVKLVYELAEPVIEDAPAYSSMQKADPTGTEEFVSNAEIKIPVGHSTRYMLAPRLYDETQSQIASNRAALEQEIADREDEIDRVETLISAGDQAIHEIVDPMIPTSVPELGSIITFDDGADGAGLKKCKIEFHATQDLHGYDHPWPAGGGVNKIPMTIDGIKSANTYGTWNGNAYSHHGLTFELLTNVTNAIVGIRVSGTCSGGAVYFNLTPGLIDWTTGMIITGCPTGGNATRFGLGLRGNNRQWDYGSGKTIDADASAAVSIWINNGYPSSNLIFYPMIRLATETDATFVPYSNICPITGWTGMEIARTGENLFDKSEDITANDYYYDENGEKVTSQNYRTTNPIKVKPGGTYFWAINGVPANTLAGTHQSPRVVMLDANGAVLDASDALGNAGRAFTTPATCTHVCLPVYVAKPATVATAMLVEGEVIPAEYQPFGNRYPISWQSEAGTLYNFTYDAVTGKIVATYAGVDMGDLEWNAASSTNNCFYVQLSQGYKMNVLTGEEILCSCFMFDGYCSSRAIGYYGENGTFRYWRRTNDTAPAEIYVHDDRFISVVDFKQAVAGQILVYELAEPIEIQLTPPGITTLKGLNNIFTNCGEITEFEYYRDTQALDAVESKYVSATTDQQFTPTQQLQARENIGATGIEYIRGTQTSQTNAWTGVSRDTALYDGKIICYYLPENGTGSSATLNLTMDDGTETGAIPVYWISTTRVTAHQARYANWLYIYMEDYVGPSGTHYGAGWWSLNRAYYTDAYPSYSCSEYTSPRTKTYLYRYMLCFSDVDKKLVPANNVSNSTATTKTLTTESFDPFGAIYYYSSTTAVADNGAPSENTLFYTYNSFDLRYSFNTGSTLTSRQPVYVVCEPQDDGRVKLAENPIVQTIPLEDNGLIYIYLGEARSTYAVCLSAYHDIYKVYNGAIYNIKALMLN